MQIKANISFYIYISNLTYTCLYLLISIRTCSSSLFQTKLFATAQLSSPRAHFDPIRRRQFRFNATSAVPKSVTYWSRQVPKCRVRSRLCKDEASKSEPTLKMWQWRERLPCSTPNARRLQSLETMQREAAARGDSRKSPAPSSEADATSMRGGVRAGYTKLPTFAAGSQIRKRCHTAQQTRNSPAAPSG